MLLSTNHINMDDELEDVIMNTINDLLKNVETSSEKNNTTAQYSEDAQDKQIVSKDDHHPDLVNGPEKDKQHNHIETDDFYSERNEEVPEQETGDQQYVVEKILDKRIDSKGFAKYLVKWEGYPSTSNTWEPLENLVDCDAAMQQYELTRATILSDKYGKKRRIPGDLPLHKSDRERKEYEVGEILGLTIVNDEKYFLINLVNCSKSTFIRSSLANRMFPLKVIDFYLRHLQWKQN